MPETELDTRIRSLMSATVDSAPDAPTFETISARLAGSADDTASTSAVPAYINDTRPRRQRMGPIAAVLAVLGVAGAGLFTFSWIAGGDGHDSPESAATAFVEAMTAEDVVGMLETLPPAEREPWTESLEALVGETERLALTQGADLGDITGVDLELASLTATPEQLGPGIVAVHLNGTLTVGADRAAMPLSEPLSGLVADSGWGTDLDTTAASIEADLAAADLFVVAVERDGSWYASPGYTLAEYIRRAQQQPLPVFGQRPIPPVGAESPTQAAALFMEALNGLNLPAIVEITAPSENDYIYDYAPLFLDEWQEAPMASPEEFVTVHSLDSEVIGEGNVRTVLIKGIDYEWTWADGSSWRIISDGSCISTSVVGGTISDSITGEESQAGTETDRVCFGDADYLADPVAWELTTTSAVTVVEEDGRWYVSPIRSVATSLIEALRLIPDAATADRLLRQDGLSNFVPTLFGSLPVVLPSIGPPEAGEEEVFIGAGQPIDPATGLPIDPATGLFIDPDTRRPIDSTEQQQLEPPCCTETEFPATTIMVPSG